MKVSNQYRQAISFVLGITWLCTGCQMEANPQNSNLQNAVSSFLNNGSQQASSNSVDSVAPQPSPSVLPFPKPGASPWPHPDLLPCHPSPVLKYPAQVRHQARRIAALISWVRQMGSFHKRFKISFIRSWEPRSRFNPSIFAKWSNSATRLPSPVTRSLLRINRAVKTPSEWDAIKSARMPKQKRREASTATNWIT